MPFAVALLAGPAWAFAQVTHLEIARAGHTRFERVVAVPIPGSPGRNDYVTEVAFVASTDRIPLEKGAGYSLWVVPRGKPEGARVALEWTCTSPPPGLVDPRSRVREREFPYTATGAIGAETRIGCQFDFPFQLLAGKWEIEVRATGARPIARSFEAR